MKKKTSLFLERVKEASLGVLPVYLIVLVVGIIIIPMSFNDIVQFTLSSFLLVMGLLLFTIGAESSMLTMGESIGSNLSKSRKIVLFVITCFVIGFFITIAEPDLAVFATQVASTNKWLFMIAIATGFAFFMTIAIFRIIFQIRVSYILFAAYSLVLVLMLLIPNNFIAIAFDGGSVTSGPISTPFILAFGLGVSAVRPSKKSQESSFGLVGISSVGSIIMVMIMGLFMSPESIVSNTVPTQLPLLTFKEMFIEFVEKIVIYLGEVGLVISAIFIVFLFFNYTMLKLPKTKIYRTIVGLVITYLGITIYLTGVTVGYLPVASVLGYKIMVTGGILLLLPLLIIIGFTIVFVEPAIHVMNKKVYEITQGQISKKTMLVAYAISMAISMILASFRVVYKIDYFLLLFPLYSIILALILFTPQIFVSIAFDSGGVITGPMSTSFLLPLISGVAVYLGSSVTEGSLGTIALIATIPLLTIQLIGVMFKYKRYKLAKSKQVITPRRRSKVEIINFGE